MEHYSIYCTAEQTKKALILHAPIKYWGNTSNLIAPTAEQMIGWLSEKMGITTFHINYYPVRELYGYLIIARPCVLEVSFNRGFKTRKEATLAAIDAALDYIIKNKK